MRTRNWRRSDAEQIDAGHEPEGQVIERRVATQHEQARDRERACHQVAAGPQALLHSRRTIVAAGSARCRRTGSFRRHR